MKRKVRIIKTVSSLKALDICIKAALADYEILAVVSFCRSAPIYRFFFDLGPYLTIPWLFVGEWTGAMDGDFSAGSLHGSDVSGQ